MLRPLLKNTKILGIAFLLQPICGVSFGQERPKPPTPPNIIPASPQSAALIKFRDVPVGMFTGTMAYNVPLYTLKLKDIEVPISADYRSNGIKVDEISSSLGTTWTLQAGGVINRTVYDKPDFNYVRATPPPRDFMQDKGATALWLEDNAANGRDMQPDEFNFSVGNYSGKFFFDNNNQPVLMPYSPLKIEFDLNRTDWNFKLTTPEGLIYYFGGNGAVESASTSGCSSSTSSQPIINGWYLNKIESSIDPSSYIKFMYKPTSVAYITSVNETITILQSSGDLNYGECYMPAPKMQTGQQFCLNNYVGNGLFLSRIEDSKYTAIDFVSKPKTDMVNDGDLLVDSMVIRNKITNKVFKSYKFSYTDVASNWGYNSSPVYTGPKTPRTFLTKLSESDQSGNTQDLYGFEYEDYTALPPRMSFAQDFYGYFNGVKTNDKSMIPLNDINSPLVKDGYVANRNPDFRYTAKGMLSKIIYPTKGYTTIEYEGNTDDPNYSIDKFITRPGSGSIFNVAATSINTYSNLTFVAKDTLEVSFRGTLSCNCPTGADCPRYPDTDPWAELVKDGVTLSSFTYARFNFRGDCSRGYGDVITIPPGDYGIGTIPRPSYQQYLELVVYTRNKSIYLPGPTPPDMPSTGSLAVAGGGVRVKKLTTYDNAQNVSKVKSYKYDGIYLPNSPIYRRTVYTRIGNINQGKCDLSNTFIENVYDRYQSNSIINLFGTGGKPVYYGKVTEYDEDYTSTVKSGGIEHYYTWPDNSTPTIVFGTYIPNLVMPNLSWLQGLDTLNVYFKMEDGKRIDLMKKRSKYIIDNRISKNITQYAIEKIGDLGTLNGSASTNMDLRLNMFNLNKISYISQWQYLNSETTETFDEKSGRTLTTTNNYVYDNPVHAQVSRTESIDSRQIKTIVNRKYPLDYTLSATATNDDIKGVKYLQDRNIKSSVIEEYLQRTNSQNANIGVTSSRFTYYKPSIALPSKSSGVESYMPLTNFSPATISSSQAILDSRYKPQLLFSTYDAYGNTLEQQKVRDSKEVYLWGYSAQYPVAKVSGSEYSIVKGFVDQSILDSAHKYTDAQIRTELNKIRNGLATTTAQVYTYTYDPLLGRTSETDAKGNIIYYEYDGFGRLMHTKDRDGKIIKRFDYKYQNQ